jgi:hypothetical protein
MSESHILRNVKGHQPCFTTTTPPPLPLDHRTARSHHHRRRDKYSNIQISQYIATLSAKILNNSRPLWLGGPPALASFAPIAELLKSPKVLTFDSSSGLHCRLATGRVASRHKLLPSSATIAMRIATLANTEVRVC